jgi:hypothetical protein
LPRTEAIHPIETLIPANRINTIVARLTGMWWPTSRFTACAWVSGPYWARPEAYTGACPTLTAPQPVQVLACISYSVTFGGGGA